MTDRSIDQVNAGTDQRYYTETEYREATSRALNILIDLYDDPDVLYYDKNDVAGNIMDAIANKAHYQIGQFNKFLKANLYRQKAHNRNSKEGDESWDEEMIALEQGELQLRKSITMYEVTFAEASKEYMTMTGNSWQPWSERKKAKADDPRQKSANAKLEEIEAKLKALG